MVASVLETAPHTKILVLADHHCPLCMHRLVEQGIAGYVVRKEFAERSVEVTGTLVCRGFYFDLGPVHSQPRTPTETPLLHTHTALQSA